MAELIHTFSQGKMNKDLDERLVPNGQYRDALNLEVADSETSQVGTFQNIKGNLELQYKTFNPNTGIRTTWLPADYITSLANPVCIGSKADENSDEIYWFIASDNTSVVAVYNTITKVTSPLIVDTQDILKFSNDYFITGINILEGMLIWTDNQTEPKKIIISDWVNSTSDFNTHSQLPVAGSSTKRDFYEEDITVIKRYPIQPPTISAYSTAQFTPDGQVAEINTQALTHFTEIAPGSGTPGTIVPKTSLSGNMTITWIGNTLPYYEIGNILKFSLSTNDPLEVDAVIRVAVVNTIGSGNSQTGAVVSILTVGPGSENQTLSDSLFDVTLEQKDPFFEFRFARFAYRYKYKNNELSAFSPFSNPAFIPGEFDYEPKQGYNLAMVNNIRQLGISDFIPADIPTDVVEVDVLYKASNNNNVYIVDSFKPVDSEWVDNSFNIKNEIITSVIQPNQILRPYDNVPKNALAQEVTGNRLIYGNYTQNFNILTASGDPKQIDMSVSFDSRDISIEEDSFGNAQGVNLDGNKVAESVKSLRSYQLGVAYMDKYGRTTPVFTGKSASVTIPKTSAPQSNKLSVKLATAQAPYFNQTDQFSHFKYYVKETSQEYYNLALDRFYPAEDDNIWLSFPSAERNKIDEDSFLILKKEHDSINPVTESARYKVVAIENEAPLYLKETKLSKGLMDTEFNALGFPIENSNVLVVDKADFDESFGEQARTESGLLIRVSSGINVSDYYKVTSFSLTASTNEVRIQCAGSFGSDMNFTSTEPYGYPNRIAGLKLELVEIETINKPEFTGRFFVKVFKDELLQAKIVSAASSLNANYVRRAFTNLYWLDGNYGDDSNFWRNQWTLADYQGNNQRLFINYGNGCGPRYTGLNGGSGSNTMNIAWAGGYGAGRNDGLRISNPQLLQQLNTNGALFRFIDADNGKVDPNGTVYQVTNTIEQRNTTWDCNDQWIDSYDANTNQITNWKITFKRADGILGLDWDPTNATDGIQKWSHLTPANVNSFIGIEFIAVSDDTDTFTTNNPAIFETEPKEATELDIYYEIPGAYPKTEHGVKHELDWFNCYAFGNGVESDRIRDDFNQPTIDNGVKASAVLDEPYEEEVRSNGLIFSQIFNSTSGVNGLNQFIQAESITKDVNPEYGSIQKLHSRDTNLVTLCENKSMKILANKDALFNADGNSNVTSNNSVLGQTITFQGEWGIGTNPESFAEFGFRMYYTDANRGGVIRLSNDGITEVSQYGLHGFFGDNLPVNSRIIGTWDMEKKNYNVTLSKLTPYWQQTLGAGQFDRLNKSPDCDQFVNSFPTKSTTVSFKEDNNGWTSRKVYIPESGSYLNNTYYTFKNGRIWEHNANTEYNNFYGVGIDDATLGSYYESSFNTIFNENPVSVKAFKTLNYSGTDQKEYIYKLTATGDKEYSLAQIQAGSIIPDSVEAKKGWYANSISTDLQEGQVKEFINKEGKRFNYIKGLDTFFNTNCDNNVDSREFNVQGIGRATSITGDTVRTLFTVTNKIDPDCGS